MDGQIILGLLASFLGGGLTASVGFLFTYSGRLTKVETTMTEVCSKLEKLNNKETGVCPFHGDLDKRLAVVESLQVSTNR